MGVCWSRSQHLGDPPLSSGSALELYSKWEHLLVSSDQDEAERARKQKLLAKVCARWTNGSAPSQESLTQQSTTHVTSNQKAQEELTKRDSEAASFVSMAALRMALQHGSSSGAPTGLGGLTTSSPAGQDVACTSHQLSDPQSTSAPLPTVQLPQLQGTSAPLAMAVSDNPYFLYSGGPRDTLTPCDYTFSPGMDTSASQVLPDLRAFSLSSQTQSNRPTPMFNQSGNTPTATAELLVLPMQPATGNAAVKHVKRVSPPRVQLDIVPGLDADPQGWPNPPNRNGQQRMTPNATHPPVTAAAGQQAAAAAPGATARPRAMSEVLRPPRQSLAGLDALPKPKPHLSVTPMLEAKWREQQRTMMLSMTQPAASITSSTSSRTTPTHSTRPSPEVSPHGGRPMPAAHAALLEAHLGRATTTPGCPRDGSPAVARPASSHGSMPNLAALFESSPSHMGRPPLAMQHGMAGVGPGSMQELSLLSAQQIALMQQQIAVQQALFEKALLQQQAQFQLALQQQQHELARVVMSAARVGDGGESAADRHSGGSTSSQASAVSSRRTTRTGSEPSNSSSHIHYLRGGGELIAPAVDSIPEHHPIAAPLPPHVATRPHRYGPPPVSTVPRVLANGRKIHGVGHAGFLDTAYA